MSLSKFYKISSDFQPKAVLEKTASSNNKPVWESIVKEKPLPSENSEKPVPAEPPVIGSEPDTKVETSQEGEPDLPDTPEESRVTIDEPPPAKPPEPLIDVEAIRDNAFTSGVIAGRQQAEEDFENSSQTLLCICNELDRLRETILQNSVGEMKELVLAISEKIIRHSVKEQEETIVATIKDSIHLAVKSDEFQIWINPEDLKTVESRKKEIINSMSGLDNIILRSDTSVERGGCKLESTCCTVDASMASQIKVIHDSVMVSDSLAEPEKTEEPRSSQS